MHIAGSIHTDMKCVPWEVLVFWLSLWHQIHRSPSVTSKALMAVTFWARFCSLFFSFFLFASNLFDQAATSRRECCTFPACHTHLHMLPASGQWLFIIHSTICLAGRRGADHWSVHLSLSCPLYLTVEINGKHPERTRTRRCITACQAVPNSQPRSLPSLWLDDCKIPSFH